MICGDFNACCGMLWDQSEENIPRQVVDEVKNEYGEMLIEFMHEGSAIGLSFVNGQRGHSVDAFTYISIVEVYTSVVDYCLVFCEDLCQVSNSVVKSMLSCQVEASGECKPYELLHA